MTSNYVLTAEESAQWDDYSIRQKNIESRLLMGWAGLSFFKRLEHSKQYQKTKDIHILVGSGNNGGDGYVVAYHILSSNLNLSSDSKKKVFLWQLKEPQTVDSKYYFQACKKIIEFSDEFFVFPTNGGKSKSIPIESKKKNKIYGFIDSLNNLPIKKIKGIVIDAIFGTGLNKAPYDKIQHLFQKINQNKNIYRIALDISSGVFANGDSFNHIVFHAHRTITFGSYKIGHVLEPGIFYSGKVNVENIGFFPMKLPNRKIISTIKKNKIQAIKNLKSHKYTSGTLFILGGSQGMEGASIMASDTFLSLGGGLVKYFSTSKYAKKFLKKYPEFMYTINSSIQKLEQEFIDALPSEKLVSVVIGIGLKETLSDDFWNQLLKKKNINLILDGSILRQLYIHQKIFQEHTLNSLILTPHYSEAESLLYHNQEHQKITNIRLASLQVSNHYKAIVYFKGAGGLLILPENKNNYKERYFNSKNYQLATGGTGDVLCGFMANMLIRYKSEKAITKAIQYYLLASQIAIQKYKHKKQDYFKASDIIKVLRKIL